MILLEGIRNLALPCTLALVIPTLVAILVGRLRSLVAAGLVVGAGVAAWAQATGAISVGRGVVVQIVMAVALAGAFLAIYLTADDSGRSPSVPHNVAAVGGSLVVGGLTSLLWEPCVGRLLGQTLTAAPTDPAGTFLPMLLFVTGALLPVWLLAALRAAAGTTKLTVVASRVGSAAAIVLVLVIGAGLWREVVSTLVRLSLT